MPICSAQRPSSCLSVCYCACPQPDCLGAYPSSARQHPQTTSLCWHPESSSRPRFVRTNGIKLSQNAAAIFSRVESESRKLPTRLNSSTGAQPVPSSPAPRPAGCGSVEAACQPREKMDWVWKRAGETYISPTWEGLWGTAPGGCLLLQWLCISQSKISPQRSWEAQCLAQGKYCATPLFLRNNTFSGIISVWDIKKKDLQLHKWVHTHAHTRTTSSPLQLFTKCADFHPA